MVFTTHSGAKPLLESARWGQLWRCRGLERWALALLCWLLASAWTSAWANDDAMLTLERQPDGLYLSARVPLTLPPELQEAMLRGVPLHFVWQADGRRTRWYWTDQRLGSDVRVLRLAFQPLTQRWRVSLGTGPLTGQGLPNALHHNLDTLDEALALVSRITRWRLMSAAELEDGAPDRIDVQFRLEAGLLPRLFQIGQVPGADASLSRRWSLVVPTTLTPPATHEGGAGQPRAGALQ